jgi:hypothetical protein
MQRDRPMIRIEREVKGKNGKYRYRIPEYGLQSGPSRQPLLDACRAVLAMGGDPSREIGPFRELRAPAHQPAVASYFGRENGREVASNSRLFQIAAPRARDKNRTPFQRALNRSARIRY